MSRSEIVKYIEDCGIIAVIRLDDTKKIMKVIDSLNKGGVKVKVTIKVKKA